MACSQGNVPGHLPILMDLPLLDTLIPYISPDTVFFPVEQLV